MKAVCGLKPKHLPWLNVQISRLILDVLHEIVSDLMVLKVAGKTAIIWLHNAGWFHLYLSKDLCSMYKINLFLSILE